MFRSVPGSGMRRRRDRVSVAIGGVALAIAVLAGGGMFRWVQALVAVLVALALVAQVSSRRKIDRISPIMVLLGLAALFTAIQLIPLPTGILDTLNPIGNELRHDGAVLAGTDPWPSISLDPASTIRALVFFLTLIGFAVLGLRIASSERGRYWLLSGVAITCGLAALVTGLHAIVAAKVALRRVRACPRAPPILGPLLNANHLGCLMSFGATISVGLAFYRSRHRHGVRCGSLSRSGAWLSRWPRNRVARQCRWSSGCC